jgi:hypothetical protein
VCWSLRLAQMLQNLTRLRETAARINDAASAVEAHNAATLKQTAELLSRAKTLEDERFVILVCRQIC